MLIDGCTTEIHGFSLGPDGVFGLRIDHRRHAPSGWRPGRRRSVRAVVERSARLLLVRSALLGDYKFPGGGVEGGEDSLAALGRELAEEAGHVLAGEPVLLGRVEENWWEPGGRKPAFVLDSAYYRAQVGPEACALKLDDYERELGFAPVWQSLAGAIAEHEALMDRPPSGLRSWIRRETAVMRWLAAQASGAGQAE